MCLYVFVQLPKGVWGHSHWFSILIFLHQNTHTNAIAVGFYGKFTCIKLAKENDTGMTEVVGFYYLPLWEFCINNLVATVLKLDDWMNLAC